MRLGQGQMVPGSWGLAQIQDLNPPFSPQQVSDLDLPGPGGGVRGRGSRPQGGTNTRPFRGQPTSPGKGPGLDVKAGGAASKLQQ